MLTRRMALVALLGAALVTVGLAPSARAADKKDVTGTWKWTMQMGRRGGQGGDNNNQQQQRPGREFTLKLKQDGEKVTGTLMSPAGGRRGGQDGGNNNQQARGRETEIKNGKITADGTLSFEVTRQGRGGNEMTTKYSGKVSGDTIKGTMSFEGQNGAQERPWEAKRAGADSDKKA